MASFKDTVIAGNLRVIGKFFASDGLVGNLTGNATSADKLNTNAGSNVIPVYFSGGKPVACKYTLGDASTKTVKNNTAAGALGWADATSGANLVPTLNTITYWNGAYSGTNSNLAYCNRGAFGTIVTKNISDFSAAGHTHSYIPLAGSSSITGSLTFTNSGTAKRGVEGIVGDSDYWHVFGGASASNTGYLEIATGDDGTEPVYVRQYSGSSVARTLTLLDASGNTTIPGTITAPTFSGKLVSSLTTSSHIAGNQGTAIINSTAAGNGYTMLAKMNSTNGVWTIGNHSGAFKLFYTSNSTINAGANNVTREITILNESGGSSFSFSGHTHTPSDISAIAAVSANGLWGMATPSKGTGANDWIRTTQAGIIPYQSGGAGLGHQSLGTEGWYFSKAYIDTIYEAGTALSSKYASYGHSHGLSYNTLYKYIDTTTSTWSILGSNSNNAWLFSIRTGVNAPAWLHNNCSAGIAFGGADTKGVISHAYATPSVRFAGGNGSSPVWYFTVSGTSGQTYNLEDLKNSVSNGKTAVANAITAKGVTTATNADFATLATNIGKINTLSAATSDATATAGTILSGYTAYVKGSKVTGTISSKAAATYTPGTSNQTISSGQYLSGAQTIKGDANLSAGNIKNGVSIFGVAGTFTSDATAAAGHILSGKTAYVNGSKITGTIASKGATTYTPGTSDKTISSGQYLSGTQTIKGDANLVAANIKSGATIFGVAGTFTSDATAAAGHILKGKTAYVNGGIITGTIASKAAATYTPGTSNQTISSGQYLSGAQTIKGDANLAAGNIKNGVSIFGVAGTFTSDATAAAGHILSGKTAYVNGSKITGTIASKGATTYTPGTSNQTIAAGQYLSGAQTIKGDANLVAANIKSGATIFGVAGSYSGTDTSDATAAAGHILKGKTAYVKGSKITGTINSKSAATYTPGTSNQTISSGQYLSGAQTIKGDANLIAKYIRSGITIFGVTGTCKPITYTVTIKYCKCDYNGNNATVADSTTVTVVNGDSYSATAASDKYSGYTLKTSSPQKVTPTGNTTVSFNYWRDTVADYICTAIIPNHSESQNICASDYNISGNCSSGQMLEITNSVSGTGGMNNSIGYYILTGYDYTYNYNGHKYINLIDYPYYYAGSYTGSFASETDASVLKRRYPIYIGNRTKSKYLGTAKISGGSNQFYIEKLNGSSYDFNSISVGDVFYIENVPDSSYYYLAGYYAIINHSTQNVSSSVGNAQLLVNLIYKWILDASGTVGYPSQSNVVPYCTTSRYTMYLGTTKPSWCA